jgi:hypothetical protein
MDSILNFFNKEKINIILKNKEIFKIIFIFFVCVFLIRLLCSLEGSEFEQPASLFAYHLIGLHNSIMYYVILILSLVY